MRVDPSSGGLVTLYRLEPAPIHCARLRLWRFFLLILANPKDSFQSFRFPQTPLFGRLRLSGLARPRLAAGLIMSNALYLRRRDKVLLPLPEEQTKEPEALLSVSTVATVS